MQTKTEPQTEFEIRLDEDVHSLFLFYNDGSNKYCLVYDKEKDKCDVLKNNKQAKLKELTSLETQRYKEVLDIAINYHHDRGSEPIN